MYCIPDFCLLCENTATTYLQGDWLSEVLQVFRHDLPAVAFLANRGVLAVVVSVTVLIPVSSQESLQSLRSARHFQFSIIVTSPA